MRFLDFKMLNKIKQHFHIFMSQWACSCQSIQKHDHADSGLGIYQLLGGGCQQAIVPEVSLDQTKLRPLTISTTSPLNPTLVLRFRNEPIGSHPYTTSPCPIECTIPPLPEFHRISLYVQHETFKSITYCILIFHQLKCCCLIHLINILHNFKYIKIFTLFIIQVCNFSLISTIKFNGISQILQ